MASTTGLLTKADLTAIDAVLYEPAASKQELTARKILRVNNSYNPFAKHIGYDWYDREGSAKIIAAGAHANDVPFVGEKGGTETQKCVDIVTGVQYTEDEINEYLQRAVLGSGPSIAIDALRFSIARRFIAEQENKLAFVGSSAHAIKGILNADGIYKEDAPQGAYSGSAAAKRLWTNKTPAEKLNDIVKLFAQLGTDGIFEAKVLALPPAQYNMLIEPYSTSTTISVMEWIKSQGAALPPVIKVKELAAAHNGDTVDYMMMLDNDPSYMELAVPRELRRGKTYEKFYNTYQIPVDERTAGAVIRHPSAIAIYKGI